MCYNNYYEILEINRYKYKHQTEVDYSKTMVTDEVEKNNVIWHYKNSITGQLSLNILENTIKITY